MTGHFTSYKHRTNHELATDEMNDLDRFHLIAYVINWVSWLGARAAYAKQAIRDKLIEHKEYIARYGDDMPDVKGWTWGQASTV